MPVKLPEKTPVAASPASIALPAVARVPLPPGLYLVATPIGNLQDISLRALTTLLSADVIACEDTRTSRVLMRHYGIPTPLVAYHDHSSEADRRRLLDRVRQGQAVALISDAGTPLIADPGYKLLREAVAEGMAVTAVPGASSVPMALSLSALPTDRFYFGGFLPPKSHARQQALAEVKALPVTLVFLESPYRIAETLADAQTVLGDRTACIARELTKQFETLYHAPLSALQSRAATDANLTRGEIVLIIAGGVAEAADEDRVRAALAEALQHLRVKDAATAIAEAHGLPRKTVYQWALELSREAGEPNGAGRGEAE